MGTLESHLRSRRDSGRKLLLPYMTGGLTEDWLDVVRAYDDAGADAVEIGIPFSDPVMDGPTIQAASDMALRNGATPISIFSDLRTLDVSIPLIVMTYANIPYRIGYERFVDECGEAGVHGAIVPDVPMEELDDWEQAVGESDLDTVLLASPITPEARLRKLCERSRGFVYGVNVLGVTGERADLASTATVLGARMKAVTDKPVVMGFGIGSPETAVEAATPTDGVVVASAIMRLLVDGGTASDAGALVSSLRTALDSI